MTPEQTAALLGYISATDPRVRRNDPDERRLQIRAWHTQLADIDPRDAAAAADAHYAQPGPTAALPGDIAGRARAATTARRRTNLEQAGDAAALPAVDPDDPHAYIAALRETRRRIANGTHTPTGEPIDARPRNLNLDRVFRTVPRVIEPTRNTP